MLYNYLAILSNISVSMDNFTIRSQCQDIKKQTWKQSCHLFELRASPIDGFTWSKKIDESPYMSVRTHLSIVRVSGTRESIGKKLRVRLGSSCDNVKSHAAFSRCPPTAESPWRLRICKLRRRLWDVWTLWYSIFLIFLTLIRNVK